MLRGNNCYCYNEKCNQKEWEKLGKKGEYQYIVISSIYIEGMKKVPKCPHCKKPMTLVGNTGEDY